MRRVVSSPSDGGGARNSRAERNYPDRWPQITVTRFAAHRKIRRRTISDIVPRSGDREEELSLIQSCAVTLDYGRPPHKRPRLSLFLIGVIGAVAYFPLLVTGVLVDFDYQNFGKPTPLYWRVYLAVVGFPVDLLPNTGSNIVGFLLLILNHAIWGATTAFFVWAIRRRRRRFEDGR